MVLALNLMQTVRTAVGGVSVFPGVMTTIRNHDRMLAGSEKRKSDGCQP